MRGRPPPSRGLSPQPLHPQSPPWQAQPTEAKGQGRAQAALRVISSSDFDLTQDPRVALGTPEDIYSFRHFDLVDVDVNPIEITGRLMLRDYSQEPWPGIAATEERLPGLFR